MRARGDSRDRPAHASRPRGENDGHALRAVSRARLARRALSSARRLGKTLSPDGGSLPRGPKADPPEVSQLNRPHRSCQRRRDLAHRGVRARRRWRRSSSRSRSRRTSPCSDRSQRLQRPRASSRRQRCRRGISRRPRLVRRHVRCCAEALRPVSSTRRATALVVGAAPRVTASRRRSGGRTWHLGTPAGQLARGSCRVAQGQEPDGCYTPAARGGVAQLVRAAES